MSIWRWSEVSTRLSRRLRGVRFQPGVPVVDDVAEVVTGRP